MKLFHESQSYSLIYFIVHLRKTRIVISIFNGCFFQLWFCQLQRPHRLHTGHQRTEREVCWVPTHQTQQEQLEGQKCGPSQGETEREETDGIQVLVNVRITATSIFSFVTFYNLSVVPQNINFVAD